MKRESPVNIEEYQFVQYESRDEPSGRRGIRPDCVRVGVSDTPAQRHYSDYKRRGGTALWRRVLLTI